MDKDSNPEELGMDQEKFNQKQKELEKEANQYAIQERTKPHHTSYIFPDKRRRDEALKAITESRQYDDALRYLSNWYPDKSNDCGVTMEFIKSPQDAETNILDFFERHGLAAERLHYVNAEEQATIMTDKPEDLPPDTQGNIIPFPKKSQQSASKAA